ALAEDPGQYGARGDAVDPHAALTELDGGTPRHLDNGRLGRRVAEARPSRDPPADAGDVDDAPASLLDHCRGGVLHAGEHPAELDRKGELNAVEVDGGYAARSTCVPSAVDDDVDAFVTVERSRNDRLDIALLEDIARLKARRRTDHSCYGLPVGLTTAGDDHGCALRGEQFGASGTDPAGASDHNGYLAFKQIHATSPYRPFVVHFSPTAS